MGNTENSTLYNNFLTNNKKMNYQCLLIVQGVVGSTAVWPPAAKPADLSTILELTWHRR